MDFILNQKIAIEVKSTHRPKEFKGLKALGEENIMDKYLMVCHVKELYLEGNIMVYPWEKFLEDLWAGKIL